MTVAHYSSDSPPEMALPWQKPFGNVGSIWGCHSNQADTIDSKRSCLQNNLQHAGFVQPQMLIIVTH